jgi:hypothetical protein
VVYNKSVEKGYLMQFLPKNFEYLTKSKKIEYKGINLKTDYLINIINEMIKKYYFSKDDTIDNEIKFNLSSTILRINYGHRYNYYIDYLIEKDFIILVSDYHAGTKARTYRIDRRFLIYMKKVLISDKTILKKNSKEYLKKRYISLNKSPIPLEIRKKLVDDLYDVKVDYDSAINYINELKSSKELSYPKYWKNYMSLEQLNNENIFFKFDEYGRMHTNFTILKRDIRKNFLKIDGEEITEIDLKNSQPLFLSVLMKKILPASKLINPEITRYFELVKNGLIYEELMNKCDIKDRNEAKIMMYKVLFGVNGDTKKYNKMFHSIFPTVYKFIKDYKKSKNNYKTLSHSLQNLESNFIFNNVINHIMKSNPEIKIFTIHDSICFPLKYRETVINIFKYYERNL